MGDIALQATRQIKCEPSGFLDPSKHSTVEIEEIDESESAVIEEIEEIENPDVKVELIVDEQIAHSAAQSDDDDDQSLLSVLQKSSNKRKLSQGDGGQPINSSNVCKTEIVEFDVENNDFKTEILNEDDAECQPNTSKRIRKEAERLKPAPPKMIPKSTERVAILPPGTGTGNMTIGKCKQLSIHGRIIKGVPLKAIKVTVNKRPNS